MKEKRANLTIIVLNQLYNYIPIESRKSVKFNLIAKKMDGKQ